MPMSGRSHPGLRHPSLTRRRALGLAGGAAALGASSAWWPRRANAATSIVSYSPSGQRWEFPQRAVYPLFQAVQPEIEVQFAAEPIADMVTKAAVALGARSSSYDTIFTDYNFVPQFIAQGALEPIEPFLDADPAYKADLLADIPENVLDLYRDKPAAEGGVLYGLPPDSNTQLQYYRSDVFEEAGIEGPAATWEDAIAIAAKLAEGGEKRTGTTLRRGLWAGGVFITLLRSHGGDWFDHMGPGGWQPQLDTDAGAMAFDVLMRLLPHLDPTSFNASDDEANTAMLNGTWTFAPVQWGGSTMNDPNFTEFADRWLVTAVPKGANPEGRVAPHMGGLGFVIPTFSNNKEAAWEWVKFACSGPAQDEAIATAWVEGTGQPARLSMLEGFIEIRPYFRALLDSLPTAMRYLPIPESNALYELVGTEVAAVVTGGKAPAQALTEMQSRVTRTMERSGYYRG